MQSDSILRYLRILDFPSAIPISVAEGVERPIYNVTFENNARVSSIFDEANDYSWSNWREISLNS